MEEHPPARVNCDERSLIHKLITMWHLNALERRALPDGCIKSSLLLEAIDGVLRSNGWFPKGVSLDDDYTGGLIELAAQGTCKFHWKTQVSFSQYESGGVTEFADSYEAAKEFLRVSCGDTIDGIPIDWSA